MAAICREFDLIALTDEVYEHLVFDGARHTPLASLPEMRNRTLTLSSAGKTFSFTGWKVGWGTGPRALVDGAQAAHQFLTYAVPTPLQAAVAYALRNFTASYHKTFRAEYTARRDFLVSALESSGFSVAVPQGTYFIMAGFESLFSGDDREFAYWLTENHAVASLPPSSFYYSDVDEGRRLTRFAFCKKMETLESAAERLGKIRK